MSISNYEASRQAEKFALAKITIVKTHTAYEVMLLQVEYSARKAFEEECSLLDSMRRYSRLVKMMKGVPANEVSGLEARLGAIRINSQDWIGVAGVAFDVLAVSRKKQKSEEENRPCFTYTCEGDAAEIHFSNAVVPKHPLKDDELKKRRAELRYIARSLKERHPDVRLLTGSSWLRNYEAYLSLFPEEHRKTVECDASAVDSMGVWGQFYRFDGMLNDKRASQFRSTWEFPLKCLSSECPIESFFEMYLK